jgi:uncharacterized protein YcbX
MPHVTRISIAPVKALGLVHPETVIWLVDETGALYNAKRDGRLLRVRAEWNESTFDLALSFPAGERVQGAVEFGEPVDAELYRKPRPSRHVRGPWEDALSHYVGRPLTFLWADDSAVDRASIGGAVSLISLSSLERLQEEAGVAALDGRRFRMTFEIDGVRPHEEDEWIGREVQIGEATVSFGGDIGRCVVTSRDPDTGVVDIPTLAALAAYRREGYKEPLACGIHGSVIVPGRVRVGDRVIARNQPDL